MADESTVAGQGPLLGWNKAQDAISALARNVDNLNKGLSDAAQKIKTLGAGAGGFAGGVLGNAGSQPYGPSTYNQSVANAARARGLLVNDAWNGSSNSSRYGNNGGRGGVTGGYGGGGAGAPRLGGGSGNNGGRPRFTVKSGAQAIVAWGQRNLPDQVTMQTTAYQAAQLSSSSTNSLVYNAFHNNFTAQSTQDAALAYSAISQQGLSPGTGSFNRQWGYITGTSGYLNPGLSQAARAQGTAAAWSPGTYNNLRAFGINTIQGGQKQTPRQIAQQIYGKFPGLKQVKTPEQVSGTLDDPTSVLNQSISSWGLDPNTLQLVKGELRGMLLAQTKGASAQAYISVANSADKGNKAAIGQLGKWKIGGSTAQTLLTREGVLRNGQVDQNAGFTDGLQTATKYLNMFSNALQGILRNTGGAYGLGWAGGAGSLIGSSVSSGLGAYAAGRGLGSILRLAGNGTTLGRLGGVLGGGGGAGGLGALGGGAAGGEGLLAAAGGAGPVGLALAAGGATAAGGWYLGGLKGQSTQSSTATGVGLASMGPFGAIALQAGMLRRGWDKLHGKNSESWLSLLNPFGHNKQANTFGGAGGANASAATGSGKSGAVATGTQGAGKTAAAVIHVAMKYLGVKYVWGGNTPRGFDCSGLIQYSFKQIGVSLPRTAAQQQKSGKPVKLGTERAGDLLFVGNPAHHVVMCIGNGKVIEAPHTGSSVRVRSYKPGEFTNAVRILGAVGNLGDLSNDNADTAGSSDNRLSTMGFGGDVGSYGSVEEVDAIAAGISPIGSANIGSGSGAGQFSTKTTDNGNNAGGALPTGNLKSWIKSALGILHQDTSANERYVNTIAMNESGGNPRAQNNGDANARAGHPSKGIMQTIDSTFNHYALAGHHNIWNPIDNIIAGVRYAESRYGSLANTPGIKSLANGGAYKGYAVGSTNIDVDQNARVHKGEMIIPAYQAEAVRQALAGNTPLVGGVGKGARSGPATLNFQPGSVVVQVTGAMDQQSARDAAQQFMKAIAEDNRINLIAAGN